MGDTSCGNRYIGRAGQLERPGFPFVAHFTRPGRLKLPADIHSSDSDAPPGPGGERNGRATAAERPQDVDPVAVRGLRARSNNGANNPWTLPETGASTL